MGNPKSQTTRVIAVSLLAGTIAWLLPHVNLVLTPSIRYSLLWIVGGQGAKGDYVAVPVRSPLVNRGHPERFTKRVGCVSGEILKFERGEHFCNGEWLDKVLPVASDGRPLQPLRWDGPIPPGNVYLVGDDPRSFDSRYLGFFDRSQTVRLKGLF